MQNLLKDKTGGQNRVGESWDKNMPMTKKGRKAMSAMRKQYGKKKGKKVFYATKNKRKMSGMEVAGY